MTIRILITFVLILLYPGINSGFCNEMNSGDTINIYPAEKMNENNNTANLILSEFRVIIVDEKGNVIRETLKKEKCNPSNCYILNPILKNCDLIIEDSHSAYFLLHKNIRIQTIEYQRNMKKMKKNLFSGNFSCVK